MRDEEQEPVKAGRAHLTPEEGTGGRTGQENLRLQHSSKGLWAGLMASLQTTLTLWRGAAS